MLRVCSHPLLESGLSGCSCSLPSLTCAKSLLLLLQGSLIIALSWLFLRAESSRCSWTMWLFISIRAQEGSDVQDGASAHTRALSWNLTCTFCSRPSSFPKSISPYAQEDDNLQPPMQLLIWGYKSNWQSHSLSASATQRRRSWVQHADASPWSLAGAVQLDWRLAALLLASCHRRRTALSSGLSSPPRHENMTAWGPQIKTTQCSVITRRNERRSVTKDVAKVIALGRSQMELSFPFHSPLLKKKNKTIFAPKTLTAHPNLQSLVPAVWSCCPCFNSDTHPFITYSSSANPDGLSIIVIKIFAMANPQQLFPLH